jgi:RNA polymerase sigma-70 factor, ECF subfamily
MSEPVASMTTADPDLIRGLAIGEEEAFSALYERFFISLLRLAQNWLMLEDAEEIVHDTLLDAADTIGSYDPSRASLFTWLIIRCRSRSIDRARQVYRRLHRVDTRSDDLALVLTSDTPHPAMEANELLASLWKELAPKEREVVVLHHYLGFPYSEVAERMHIKESTVREYAKRTRVKLRKLL